MHTTFQLEHIIRWTTLGIEVDWIIILKWNFEE
jgi:hypothetical protein